MPELLEAYRNGGGVSWDELGDNAREAQAAVNRPWFEQELGTALAGVAELHDAQARPGARIADVGAASAGRRSRSRRRTRGRVDGSTSTPRRSRWPAATPPRPGSTTG